MHCKTLGTNLETFYKKVLLKFGTNKKLCITAFITFNGHTITAKFVIHVQSETRNVKRADHQLIKYWLAYISISNSVTCGSGGWGNAPNKKISADKWRSPKYLVKFIQWYHITYLYNTCYKYIYFENYITKINFVLNYIFYFILHHIGIAILTQKLLADHSNWLELFETIFFFQL